MPPDAFFLDRSQFRVADLNEPDDAKAYWLTKSPQERVAAMEFLRQSLYAYDPATTRLQRVLEITELERSYNLSMNRESAKLVLESEMARWSALSWDDLVASLADTQGYEVKTETGEYQIEAQLIERTEDRLCVMLAVDVGFPRRDMTGSFFRYKKPAI